MLITLIGALSASHFAEHWKKLVVNDAILGFFMSQMVRADVVQAAAPGTSSETVSLLAARR